MTTNPTTEFDWENGDDAFPLDNMPLTEDKRTEARICTVQALYQALLMSRAVEDVAKEFEVTRLPKRKADKKLFALVSNEAAQGRARYETMIKANLREDWPWERLDNVLKALLWAGLAELTANSGLGLPVIVNEYVNIAKGFVQPEQVGFVNRTLDAAGKTIRG